MARINYRVSESLSEFLVLTDWVEAPPEQVSLRTNLGPISLEYPFFSARMQCVVGQEEMES